MKFEKVSLKQYAQAKGLSEKKVKAEYDGIKIPERGTKKSAGYDFFSPVSFTLKPGESVLIPTGIRVLLDDDKYLMCAPRSGLGFNYRLQLDNTIGIVDADYANAENEGHIIAKLTNDTHEGKELVVEAGKAIFQGVINQYFTVEDDNASEERVGGFGSTDSVSADIPEDVSHLEEVIIDMPLDAFFEEPHQDNDNEVVLYTTHCPKCNILVKKLDEKSVQYKLVDDIDEMEKLGIMSAPQLKVGGNIMDYLAAVKWVNGL